VAQLPAGGHEVVGSFAGRKDGDIADAALVAEALDRLKPELVFNAAAWTDVDGAEDHPQEARRANAEGPEALARACAARGIHLVHYSTDFVFDGQRETPYDESVAPGPQSVYAATKLEGERRVEAACPQSFVLRVGCLYGRNGRNFPSTLLRRLRAGELIRADSQRRVSPTWVVPVAQLSARLAGTRYFGLYHSTAQGETSWFDYARFVAEAAGLRDARIEAVDGTTLKLKAARPRYSVLISRRLPEVGLDPLPPWQEQSRAYIASEG
jgi:dTDP-4-dehydrorhamnose reductase